MPLPPLQGMARSVALPPLNPINAPLAQPGGSLAPLRRPETLGAREPDGGSSSPMDVHNAASPPPPLNSTHTRDQSEDGSGDEGFQDLNEDAHSEHSGGDSHPQADENAEREYLAQYTDEDEEVARVQAKAESAAPHAQASRIHDVPNVATVPLAAAVAQPATSAPRSNSRQRRRQEKATSRVPSQDSVAMSEAGRTASVSTTIGAEGVPSAFRRTRNGTAEQFHDDVSSRGGGADDESDGRSIASGVKGNGMGAAADERAARLKARRAARGNRLRSTSPSHQSVTSDTPVAQSTPAYAPRARAAADRRRSSIDEEAGEEDAQEEGEDERDDERDDRQYEQNEEPQEARGAVAYSARASGTRRLLDSFQASQGEVEYPGAISDGAESGYTASFGGQELQKMSRREREAKRRSQRPVEARESGGDGAAIGNVFIPEEDVIEVAKMTDFALATGATQMAPTSRPQDVLYMEEMNGFKKVKRGDEHLYDDTEVEPVSATSFVRGVVSAHLRLGMFAEGLLGGAALFQGYVSYSQDDSNIKLIAFYYPLARAVQTFYFILLVCALVAACDRYERMHVARSRWGRRAASVFAIIAYALALLFSLGASAIDSHIYEYGDIPTYWASGGQYANEVRPWRALNILRMALSLFGWALVAYSSVDETSIPAQPKQQQQGVPRKGWSTPDPPPLASAASGSRRRPIVV